MKNPFTAVMAGLLIGFALVAAVSPRALRLHTTPLNNGHHPAVILQSDPLAL
jgi:hypothetical protein